MNSLEFYMGWPPCAGSPAGTTGFDEMTGGGRDQLVASGRDATLAWMA